MKNNHDVKGHWDDTNTESMYDKNLLEIEIQSILEHLESTDRVLDLGCGEGEGTIRYYDKVKELDAIDYSETRLRKLKAKNHNIHTIQMDMKDLAYETLGKTFDKIITQRSLINLQSFEEQKRVIMNIHDLLEDNGKYIMLEGFNEGVASVNHIRNEFKLAPIDVKWHNLFFNKSELLQAISPYFELETSRDFSLYFFVTRVFNAILKHPEIPRWDDPVNELAMQMDVLCKNTFMKGVSRLELLVFTKKN